MNVNLLKAVMAEQGMNAKQLAHKLDMAESALSLRMTGRREFRVCEIKKIIKILKLTYAQIVAIFFDTESD